MLNSFLSFIGPILAFLVEKYGVVGTIVGYLTLVVAPAVSVLIEVGEAYVLLTANPNDDVAVAKAKSFWVQNVTPVLEILPHVNIPIAPAIAGVVKMIGRIAKAVLAAFGAWKSSE